MRLAPALLVAFSASPLAAEGARESYDCRVVTACDAVGVCAPADGSVSLVVAPVETDAAGGGTLTVARDGAEPVAGSRVSAFAPVVWSEGPTDSQALLLTGEASAASYRLDLAAGVATVEFLTCEVIR